MYTKQYVGGVDGWYKCIGSFIVVSSTTGTTTNFALPAAVRMVTIDPITPGPMRWGMSQTGSMAAMAASATLTGNANEIVIAIPVATNPAPQITFVAQERAITHIAVTNYHSAAVQAVVNCYETSPGRGIV